MPIVLQGFASFAFGELAAAITNAQTSFAVVAGEGARFDSISAGQYYYIVVIDQSETQYARFEVMKVTALATDTFTVTRAQQGTTAKAFPITGTNSPANVKVMTAHTVRQMRELTQGGGAVIQAGAPTLTSDHPELIILTPVAPITVALPTTTVWAGRRFKFVNLGVGANTITINASGGGNVAVLPAGYNMEVVANKDTPTAAADWNQPTTYIVAPRLNTPTLDSSLHLGTGTFSGGSVSGAAAAGQVNYARALTDAFGVAASEFRLGNDQGTIDAFGGGAAKTVARVGVDVTASNVSQTITSSQAVGAILTIPAASLNANGRSYRVTIYLDSNTANTLNATIQIRLDGSSFLSIATGGAVGLTGTVVVTITRIGATTAVIGWTDDIYVGAVRTAMVPAIGNNNVFTITNFTGARNFDVNVSAWAAGTLRSMIVGEQLG